MGIRGSLTVPHHPQRLQVPGRKPPGRNWQGQVNCLQILNIAASNGRDVRRTGTRLDRECHRLCKTAPGVSAKSSLTSPVRERNWANHGNAHLWANRWFTAPSVMLDVALDEVDKSRRRRKQGERRRSRSMRSTDSIIKVWGSERSTTWSTRTMPESMLATDRRRIPGRNALIAMPHQPHLRGTNESTADIAPASWLNRACRAVALMPASRS